MKEAIFKGCATAIITPFTQDGNAVNYKKLEELIAFQIKNHADALIVCGTTGEAPTLTAEEQKNVIQFTVEKVNKRIPVIAGTGSNCTKISIEASISAQEVGADAVLVVTPYYNKTSQHGLIEHFSQIAKAISLPVILYNVPSRTTININPETAAKLSEIPNINAIKECNLEQMLDVATLCKDRLHIYSGNDHEVLPCLSYGGLGVISVMSNLIVSDIHQMVHDFFAGKIREATAMQKHTHRLNKALFCDVNPIPIKGAMNLLGMDVGPCRLPLMDPSEDHFHLIRTSLEEYGLTKALF
jgi:4-hydroxy-tetrahydrodipicolinate synthase